VICGQRRFFFHSLPQNMTNLSTNHLISLMSHFSSETKRVFLLAINEASHLGYFQVEPEHLLLGLARARGEVGQELFNSGLSLERLRWLVGQGKTSSANSLPTYSEATKQLVKLAREVARDEIVTPKDLLLAIIQHPQTRAYEILKTSGELERLITVLSM
jgi:ATP-dependent Clp protease ATP-binding subunit ClpA